MRDTVHTQQAKIDTFAFPQRGSLMVLKPLL